MSESDASFSPSRPFVQSPVSSISDIRLPNELFTCNFDLAIPVKFDGGVNRNSSFPFLKETILKDAVSPLVSLTDLATAGNKMESALLLAPLMAEKMKFFVTEVAAVCASV